MMTLGRRYRFSAAHTLRSPRLSAAENARVYGNCANPGGHGHDYTIEVVMSGTHLGDDVLIGRGILDDLVAQHVAPRFAYRDLNASFGPEFIPTGENLTQAVHELLSPYVPPNLILSIRLSETDKNAFACRSSSPEDETAR